MAWTAKPAKGTYSLDAGSAFKPTHLWMFDEASGTSQGDIGSGTPLDATLVNADMWTSDGTIGAYVLCANAGGSERYAYSATGTLGSSNALIVAVFKSTTSVASSQYVTVQCLSTSSTTSPTYGIRYAADEKPYCVANDNTNTNTGNFENVVSYDQAWHLVAYKVQDNAVAVSVDGAAWTAAAITLNYPNSGGSPPNRYGFGAKVDSAPDTFLDGGLAAVWSVEDGTYADWDDAYIAALYNSGDPWSKFLTTSALTSQQPQFYKRPNTLLRM